MALTNPQMLQALGRVAVHAAIVEQQIHVAYWQYAGLTRGVGQIITGHMRPKIVFQDLFKIANETKAISGRIVDLEEISLTYGALAEQRNELLHWIWQSDAEDKEHTVYAPGYMRGKYGVSKPYTVEQVNAIADGLKALSKRLNAHTISEADLLAYQALFGAERHAKHVPAPWLDKSSPPSPKPRKTPQTQKKRSRQPRASRA